MKRQVVPYCRMSCVEGGAQRDAQCNGLRSYGAEAGKRSREIGNTLCNYSGQVHKEALERAEVSKLCTSNLLHVKVLAAWPICNPCRNRNQGVSAYLPWKVSYTLISSSQLVTL